MFRAIRFGIAAKIISLTASAILAGCAATTKPEKMGEPEPAEPAMRTVTKEVVLDTRTLFAFDSAELTSEGRAALDKLVRDAGGKTAGEVTITGHTDRIGPENYNMGLSERRANTVADYMAQKGVPADAITTYARGETEPLVECEDQPWRALVECLQPNRRVVVEYPTTVEEEAMVEEN